ncbi:zinc finger BED domain-containing protein 4-like [Onthophagus taurus]|uniref:zinc finger BED domain-containing protein 4-like n=1 Tax=Onthophagus taurus TaxID=166361 RepID=UPI0039BE5AF3
MTVDSAKCKQCGKSFSRKGGGTTSLKLHLKSQHSDKYEELLLLEKGNQQNKPQTAKQVTPLQECKKQLTLKDSFKNKGAWDESNTKQKEIDKLVAEMIVLQNLPFNFVEGVGFQRLVQAALPRYNLRGRQYFTNLLCNDIYNKMKLKILDLLKQFEKLSFTTDVWSEPSANVSLLSLTAHGITNNYEKISIILKCEQLEGRHTGEIIANHLNNILQDWGLSNESVHCILRDKGSNMIKAMSTANFPDANCTIHQLQLCVRSAMETEEFISPVVTKCKKIATHFHHSLIAQNELKQIQTERLNQTELCIVQDCSTRWNSTYYMMERILKLKDSLILYSGAHTIPIPTADEWLDLEKCIAILKPFEEITKEFSSATATIASVIPLIYTLKNTLETEKIKEDTSENFKLMITKMVHNISVRFQDIENNKIYTIVYIKYIQFSTYIENQMH